MSSAETVARNSLYGLLALAVDKGVFMAIILVLARYLGPEDFGRWVFVITYIAVFQVIADLGIEMVVVRRLSQEPGDRDELMANALTLRLLSGAAGWIVAVICMPLVADSTYIGLTLIAGSCLLTTTWTAYKILYRSLLRIEFLLLLISFNAAATAACLALVLLAHGQLTATVATMAFGSAVSFPFAIWLSRRQFRFRLRYDLVLWRSVVREALPLGINAVLVNLSLRIGPLLLMRLRGPKEVAYFSAASKLVEAFVLLPEVPLLTIFPLMAAAGKAPGARLAALSRSATKWIVILLLPLVLGVSGLAEPLLRLLYGESFVSAQAVLRVLVWATAFAATGAVWIGVLTTLGLQRFLMRFYGMATALNALLALVLIPRLDGVGAALAALIAAAASQLLLIWLPATASYIRPAFVGVVPAFVIATVLAVTTPMLPLPPVFATALCLLGYTMTIAISGAIGPEERRLARRIFDRRAAASLPS